MDHLGLFESVTSSFESGLRAADPASQLASIDWTVGELGAHLGGVHEWVAAFLVSGAREPRENVPAVEGAIADYYAERRRRLLDVFAGLPADTACWTMSPLDRTVAFWHRRQLHESLVHLWDLRSASSMAPPSDLPPEVYADAVDELFATYLARFAEEDRAVLRGTIALRASDLDREWDFGPGFAVATSEPDAVVTAPAGALMLIAWNRLRADRDAIAGATVTGDPAVVEQFHAAPVRP